MKDFQIKKLYYSISEVSKMVGLEQYVLRYWESEFEQLRPQKNRAGNRVYTNKEIELVRLIKKLTREHRYTIEGARQILETMDLEAILAPAADGETTEFTIPGAEPGINPRAEIPATPAESTSQAPPPDDLRRDLQAIRGALVQILNVLDSAPDQNIAAN
ncbi:MAG: MerR family transcriptional regulator [Armatimonadetes bacterium]|nr:MerR family transcriptional regulator [Armatimonadota bacterium]